MEIQIQSCDGEGRLSQFMSELGTLQKLCGIWLNVRIGQMQRIFKTDMTKKKYMLPVVSMCVEGRVTGLSYLLPLC